MRILSNGDYLSVKLFTLLADYDRDTLINLYEPIVGYDAISIYFSLWSEAKKQEVLSMSSHEKFLIHLKMATGEFIEARKRLEAIGLMKTYLEETKDICIYHYVLFAPKTPEKFINDALLYGLLVENIGVNEANRIKSFYKIDKGSVSGKDISANFLEVFNPDFTKDSFQIVNDDGNIIGRKKSKIDSEFSFEKFFSELSKCSQISSSGITKKEMKEIERLSTLFGIKEDISSNCVASIYDYSAPKGKRIDSSLLNKQLMREMNLSNFSSINNYKELAGKEFNDTYIESNSDLAKKINMLETKSPREYLSFLQNNTLLANPDLKLIEDLSRKFNLNNAVINVILDIVLNKNDNVLSRSYAEKIAGSFAREGITTALDAMNYYNKTSRKNKGYKKDKIEENLDANNSNAVKNDTNYEDIDKELDDFFKEDKLNV